MAPMTWEWTEEALAILIIVVAAVILRFLLVRTIRAGTKRALAKAKARREGTMSPADRILAAATFANDERYEQRTATLGSLLTSIITVTVYTIAILTAMDVLNIPLGPVLTSAGIGGVAFGFGAQSLVKDFLSGVFMILEDQYGVGDLIDTGEVIGTVEEVGLRVTRLRDGSGQVWYVRNGEIVRVGNLTQGWSTAVADVPIAPDEDAARAIEVLAGAATAMADDPEVARALLEGPTVVGVNAVTATGIEIRLTARTKSNQHWGVQRAMLAASVAALAQAGIRGPVPGPPQQP